MIWPWSRIRELERERDRARSQAEYERLRAESAETFCREAWQEQRELVQQIIAMKRDGFNPPEPAPDPVTDSTPAVVLDALRERLPEGSREWRAEHKAALAKLEAGADANEVADGILRGNESFSPW